MLKSTNLMVIIASIPFLFSSCASILNGKHQDVVIKDKGGAGNETKIYVNDTLRGDGNTVKTTLKRNVKPKQIKVHKEGYLPEYEVHFQYKRSPWYIMSVVPFGILLYPATSDALPTAFDHKKEFTLNSEVKVNEKSKDQKYVFMKNTAFNIGEDELDYRFFHYEEYHNGEEPYKKESSSEAIDVDDSEFTEAVNKVLYKHGYIDTTDNIFRDQTNTMYISASIEDVDFNFVRANHFNYDNLVISPHANLSTEIDIEWEIADVYQQKKFETTDEVTSGTFTSYVYENPAKAAVQDAIYTSFFEIMKKPKVQKLLKKDKKKVPEFNPKSLSVTSAPKSLQDAQEATVTIKYEDGHGSGCTVSQNGHIVTNYHVVAGEEDPTVILNDGREFNAKIVRKNEYDDLALLKIDHNFKKAFNFPADKNYKSGQTVYAVGTPSKVELGQTLSKGIVSGVRNHKDREYIQSDVSVSGGNSGGALVNENGDLVGIVTSKMVGYSVEGITFSLPAHTINDYLRLEATR